MIKPFVAVMMGSDSDLDVMQSCLDTLTALQVHFESHILSAHRTPDTTVQYVHEAEQRGCVIYIAAAGLAAHLAGTVAAHTIKPVIGIPLNAGSLGGLDALLSTVQMPGGTPVACVSIGKAGSKNAAILAAEILAIHDDALRDRLQAMRQEKRQGLKSADEKLQQRRYA